MGCRNPIIEVQVNLCQKLFFLQNMKRTCCVPKLPWMSETISIHNMFSPGLSLEFSWTYDSMNSLSSYCELDVTWCKNNSFCMWLILDDSMISIAVKIGNLSVIFWFDVKMSLVSNVGTVGGALYWVKMERKKWWKNSFLMSSKMFILDCRHPLNLILLSSQYKSWRNIFF